jgi:hypothetical protein
MIVLAATMLLFGGGALVNGLVALRDPGAQFSIRNIALAPAAEEAARKLEPIFAGSVDRHRPALRAKAIVSIGLGLFMLYAVAAILSRDRNGRRLALLTAIFGVAYLVAGLPLTMAVWKEVVVAGGPLLLEAFSAAGQTVARTPVELLAALNVMAALLVLAGVGWCVLVLVYFGGRRGRELYGLPRNPLRVPNLSR